MIRQNIILALRGISGNRVRAVLTMLIIAIGIMALVGIFTAIDSMNNSISRSFSSLGSNSFTIRDGNFGIRTNKRSGNVRTDSRVISYAEATAFQKRYHFPSTVSLNAQVSYTATVKFGEKKTNPNVGVFGADDRYIAVSGLEMQYGRYFSPQESEAGSDVVVLGNDVAQKIFDKPENSLDTFVLVGSIRYRVVGVLKAKGSSFVGSDNKIIIPLNTARRNAMSNETRIIITVAIKDVNQLEDGIAEAKGLMRNVRRIPVSGTDDFSVIKSDAMASTVKGQLSYVALGAFIIGIVTLLGAAVALMNIMLVSVTERTREIGVNKAIGATRQHILLQFLTEALVICQIGGLAGIALGIGAGNIVSLLMKAPFVIPWEWVGLGILFCFIVGLAAGIYPAYRAASLDPVDALRYE